MSKLIALWASYFVHVALAAWIYDMFIHIYIYIYARAPSTDQQFPEIVDSLPWEFPSDSQCISEQIATDPITSHLQV